MYSLSEWWANQVDLVAPGENIRAGFLVNETAIDYENPSFHYAALSYENVINSPLEFNYSAHLDGTSFAAVHVSAAAANIKAFVPGIRVNDVKTILTETAHPIDGVSSDQQGHGRLDVGAAVHALEIPGFSAEYETEEMAAKETSGQAQGGNGFARVQWADFDESILPFQMYRLYRSEDGAPEVELWHDIPRDSGPYLYIDDTVEGDHVYSYNVDAYRNNIWGGIDIQGRTKVQSVYVPPGQGGGGLEEVAPSGIPTEPKLASNFPNPFNPSTTIRFALSAPGQARLLVLNTRGQLVRVLVDGDRPAGWHTVTWDGGNDYGREVASGIYLYVLEAEGKRLLRRMLLVR